VSSCLFQWCQSVLRLRPAVFMGLLVYCALVTTHAVEMRDVSTIQKVTDTLQIAAASLFICAGALQLSRSRIIGEPRTALLGAAIVIFGVLQFPMTIIARLLHEAQAAIAFATLTWLLATVITTVLVVVAVWKPDLGRRVAPNTLIGSALVGVLMVVGALAVLQLVIGVDLDPTTGTRVVVGSAATLLWVVVGGAVAEHGVRNPDDALPDVTAGFGALGVVGLLQTLAVFSPVPSALAAAVVTALVASAAVTTAGIEHFELASHEQIARRAVTARLIDAERLLVAHGERLEDLVHDARNAIAALRMASVTMSSPGDLDAEDHERLAAAMMSEIGQLEHLIAHSRGEEATDFDVAEVLRPVADAQRTTGLSIELDLDGAWARGRPGDLATVVQNLLVNARLHAAGSSVRLTAQEGSSTAEILVEDHGPGVPTHRREAIFGRGVRGMDSSGSGLGLHVAQSLMRGQGGEIDIRDNPGGGTVFVLTLPRAVEPHHRRCADRDRAPSAPRDEPAHREALEVAVGTR